MVKWRGTIFSLACTIAMTVAASGQSSWQWQNPLPQGNSLYGLKAVGRNNAFAVGEAGTLGSTTDRGNTWNFRQVIADNSIALYSVSFLNAGTGAAVGTDGTILVSNDGGVNWFPRTSPATGQTLRGITNAGASKFVAVGDTGTIIRSTDGGISWVRSSLVTTTNFRAVHFPTSTVGYAVGDGGIIMKSLDGGITWGFVPDTALFRDYSGVWFVSRDTGWVVGASGTIINTTNGGASWVRQFTGVPQGLSGVAFNSALTGVAVGDQNMLYTSNGGFSWIPTALDPSNDLNAVAFADTSIGYIAGDNGEIKLTFTGGQSWTRLFNNSTTDLYGSSFTDASHGWAVGEFGTIMHTTDGGGSWIKDPSPTTSTLRATWFTPANVGWAVGDADSLGTLLKTSDGISWARIPVDTAVSLYALHFTDPFHGWAVGQRGTVLRTTDGINWTRSTIDTSYTLSAVFFVNNSRGYVCANHGPTADRTYILQTADGGASWILPTPTNGVYDDPRTLLSLYFISSDTGFAVGKFHRLLRTTNGGFTWSALPNPVRGSNHFLDVQFVNSRVGTVVGTSGTIIRTVDGGRNWFEQQTPTDRTLYSCSFADADHGWVFGSRGSILNTNDGGGGPPPPPPPGGGGGGTTNTHLSPNFPSPFVPSLAANHITYLPFRITTGSFVKVRIFNILGRLIREIPEQFYPAGKYEDALSAPPAWDGTDDLGRPAPTGFYFYEIFTSEYIEGQRMILVR